MSELEAKAAAAKVARDRLAETLDAIEDRVNVPKRVSASFQQNPVPWVIGGVLAVGAVVGGIIWAIARDD